MKTYTLQTTKHPDIFRVVDMDGNWKHYALRQHKSECHGAPTTVKLTSQGEIAYCGTCKQQCAEVHIYLRGVTTVIGEGYPKGFGLVEFFKKHTAEEAELLLAAGSSRGDKVHRYIDIILTWPEGTPPEFSRDIKILDRATKNEEPLTNKEWGCMLSFRSFWDAHDPILLSSEGSLYNLKEGYAGTMDALLILRKACSVSTCKCAPLVGKVGIWDWKTAKGIFPDYSAQIAAYAESDNMGEYLPPDVTIEYGAIIRFGTSHVKTGGYAFEAYMVEEYDAAAGPAPKDSLQSAYQRFLAAKLISDYEYKGFDPKVDIQEIPDSFQLPVQHFDFKAARWQYEEQERRFAALKEGDLVHDGEEGPFKVTAIDRVSGAVEFEGNLGDRAGAYYKTLTLPSVPETAPAEGTPAPKVRKPRKKPVAQPTKK